MPTTDLFLTHDWGKDEHGRDNHFRVQKINEALKSMGYITWFDNDRMEGNIPDQMALGIQNTKIVLVFITKRYEQKVTGENPNDNCKLEFNYATLNKTSAKIIAIVMEKGMKNPSVWNATLGMYLGNKLFTDMSGDIDDAGYFNGKLQLLSKEITSMGVHPRHMEPVKELKSFLHSISIDQYLQRFEETGNEDLNDLCTLNEEELDDVLTKDVQLKSGHSRKFVKALNLRKADMQLHPTPIDFNPSEFRAAGTPIDFKPSGFQLAGIVSPVSSNGDVPDGRSNGTSKKVDNANVWKKGRFDILNIVNKDIANDWRHLGQLLRIDNNKLNVINVDGNDTYDKAAKTLELWEYSHKIPSWGVLEAALQQIPRFDILRKIEKVLEGL